MSHLSASRQRPLLGQWLSTNSLKTEKDAAMGYLPRWLGVGGAIDYDCIREGVHSGAYFVTRAE